MQQRTRHNLTITFDVIQNVDDNISKDEFEEKLDRIITGIERNTIQAVVADYGGTEKVKLTGRPSVMNVG